MANNIDGILLIDIFNSTTLHNIYDEMIGSSASIKENSTPKKENLFDRFHQLVRSRIEMEGGEVWNIKGDEIIANRFRDIDAAVRAAMGIQSALFYFNIDQNNLPIPIIVRIGITMGSLPYDLPENARGKHADHNLDEAGHLEGDCPPGRIRISRKAFEALRQYKDLFRPGLSKGIKPGSKGSLVWVDRYLTREMQERMDHLTLNQRRCYPLIYLSSDDYKKNPFPGEFSQISEILKDSFVIIGETRHGVPGDTAVSHPAPTSDAVGIMEIFAAMSEAKEVAVGIDEWADTSDLACNTNIVIIGSPVVNIYSYAVNTVTPAGFVRKPESPLSIRVPENGGERFFPASFDHSELDRQMGLVLLTHNPMNPKYAMLWIAGISGMATQAAARFVRNFIVGPSSAIDRIPADIRVPKPNIAVVRPAWESPYEKEHYIKGGWRISEYKEVWLGRQ